MATKSFSAMLFNTMCKLHEKKSIFTVDQISMERLLEFCKVILAEHRDLEVAFRNLYTDILGIINSDAYTTEFDIDLNIVDSEEHLAQGVMKVYLVEYLGGDDDAQLILNRVREVLDNKYPNAGPFKKGYTSGVLNDTTYANIATWTFDFKW